MSAAPTPVGPADGQGLARTCPTSPGVDLSWEDIGCFLLLLAGLQLVAGPTTRLGEWSVDAATNVAFAEALAWHDGRLDIPRRVHDSAIFQDRVYNINPPLFTLVCYSAVWFSRLLGERTDIFYPFWYVLVVAVPLPFVAYGCFARLTQRPPWAALLAAAWILGSPILPALAAAREGGISHINHLLSQAGLMLVAGSLLVGARLRWSLVGLLWAAWSRPLTILYVLPIAVAAWKGPAAMRGRRLAATLTATTLALALPMTLNHLKFGSPLETGYRYLYEGRQDELARQGREALFSLRFAGRNAWYMNVEPPGFEAGPSGLRPKVDPHGASIWLTMPILLFVWLDARSWLGDSNKRNLMLASFLVAAGLLCFHNTGYVQPGYYRFALDFVPIWLAVIAQGTDRGLQHRRLTIAAAVWSMLYFNLVTRMYA